MNKFKQCLEKRKLEKKRFRSLSSEDKLEYYTRFGNLYRAHFNWNVYLNFILIQTVLMVIVYMSYTSEILSGDQLVEFWILFITLSKLLLVCVSLDLFLNGFGVVSRLHSEKKWLIEKGVKNN